MAGFFVTSIMQPRAFAALVVLSLAGCSKAPAEPDPPPPAASAAPAVAPLTWQAPGTWTTMDVPHSPGPKKASYRIPKQGDDKEEAEVNVFFFGTGAGGDPAKNFGEWFSQFDGDAGKAAAREELKTQGGLAVETVDVKGTYKIAMGPKVGPNKKAPMQMVKENFRLYGAVVKTPDRGNWFFKLTGPDETVQAARSAFRALLESAK